MAKSNKTASKKRGPTLKNNAVTAFFKSKQTHLVFGIFIFTSALFLLISFYSFFMHWKEDQSQLKQFADKSLETKNVLGKLGATISDFLIYDGFGIATFIFPILLFFTGLYAILNIPIRQLRKWWFIGILFMIWTTLLFGYVDLKNSLFAGKVGLEWNEFLQIYIGKIGVFMLLFFSMLLYLVWKFKVTPEKIKNAIPKAKIKEKILPVGDQAEDENDFVEEDFIVKKVPKKKENTELELSVDFKDEDKKEDNISTIISKTQPISNPKMEVEDTLEIEVENPIEEESEEENLSDKLVKDFGEFDPKLELSNYKFPTLNLLQDYKNENITINKEELENNKNKIVETLNNYKIGIASIKATIGPTVTLYEIVPNAGVRISKIKNLEDDIALSLSALGIRIIAPIPGKGTIGIEVPNKNPSIVSMKSVLSSQKFQSSEMELPIALGKTISNETFVVDLAKMPHLLMAGATGQGKSVGLNAVLASLLYKKHPAEVKFVLVDPKKVELTLFNKIERHYLAKLPDTEEAIITDTTRVIYTLNSLCIEMDNRYDLLKAAFVRNIKEYNVKFKARKLNPENGHRYLPYIVLVIDEFADLIMTAGKEIETPIARLAQLARAIGIHLIVATQRPSVNVITGIIKGKFSCSCSISGNFKN